MCSLSNDCKFETKDGEKKLLVKRGEKCLVNRNLSGGKTALLNAHIIISLRDYLTCVNLSIFDARKIQKY